jgi:hypothetical protein
MYCPICDQKTINCDCTAEERRMHCEIEEIKERLPIWILCSERMPEEHQHVIGWKSPWSRAGEVWRNDEFVWFSGDFEQVEAITHWMPMPEPPEANA